MRGVNYFCRSADLIVAAHPPLQLGSPGSGIDLPNRGMTLLNMRIHRDALYQQVWTEPMTKVAKRLGISDVFLARVCQSLQVPHPPRGYWARKAAGEHIEVPALPPVKPGDAIEWVRGYEAPKRASFSDYSPPAKRAQTKPKSLSAQHALVGAWRAHLEEGSPDDLGYTWTRKKNVLDAFVTQGMVRQAAATLNALFNELENRGHTVRLETTFRRPTIDIGRKVRVEGYGEVRKWEAGCATIALVADIPFGLAVFEPAEHVRVRRVGTDRYVRHSDLSPTRRYAPQSPDEADMTRDMPTGRLVLKAYSPIYDTEWSQQWQSEGPASLTERAAEIVDALQAAAPQVARLAAEAERRAEERRKAHEAQQRAWRKEERARARVEARKKAVEELRAIAKAWNDAYALEAFFDALHRRGEHLEPPVRAELDSRIAAARALLGAEDAVERFLKWKLAPPATLPDGDDDQE